MGSGDIAVASFPPIRRSNSATKMSGAMALVASSRSSSFRTSGGVTKRRSLAECGTASAAPSPPHSYSLRKRPRTDRGRKPHPNPSFLVLPSPSPVHAHVSLYPFTINSAASPSPPPSPPLASSSATPPPLPPSSVYFIKTEPLQNLAIVLPDAIDDHEFSCFAPSYEFYDEDGNGDHSIITPTSAAASFFPALEHLLIENNSHNNNVDCIPTAIAYAKHYAENSNSCSTITCSSSSSSALQSASSPSPVSPLSTTSMFCSYSSDGGSGSDDIIPAWDDCAPAEASCDFLCSDRFYEIEKEMSCIMGDVEEHGSINQEAPVDELIANVTHSADRLQKPIRCSNSSSSSSTSNSEVVQINYPKSELDTELNSVESRSAPPEIDGCRTMPAGALLSEVEEYSIDLMDFEPESAVASSTCAAMATAADLDSQLVPQQCSSESSRCLALKLDFEELMREWSDRAPLLTDGSDRPVAVELDLTAWEPENQMVAAQQEWGVGVGKMIRLPESAGAPAAEGEEGAATPAAPPSAVQRHASVLRYREKRRTRLFAKKIRYEVRKLNAERRPRMKGRFIKRSSLD